jgi:hypothetical protein
MANCLGEPTLVEQVRDQRRLVDLAEISKLQMEEMCMRGNTVVGEGTHKACLQSNNTLIHDTKGATPVRYPPSDWLNVQSQFGVRL